MNLITHLQSVITENQGIVQVQLAKEDLARIEKLVELAQTHSDPAVMEKDALYIGWTKGDFRTHELSGPLKKLIRAVYDYVKLGPSEARETDIMNIWVEFHKLRLKVLVHCL